MRVEDQYPSADDALEGTLLPPMAGGTQDPVLDTLRAGRARIEESWTEDAFIYRGSVCAVGSVLAADGLTEQDISKTVLSILELFEVKASEAAREAIRLLNAAAVELYPWAEDSGWSGPFEAVNQMFASYEDVSEDARYSLEGVELDEDSTGGYHPAQAAILRIYDHTIGQRSLATA